MDTALKITGSLAFTAILVLIAIILYKKLTGGCGCTEVPLSLETMINSPGMGTKKSL